jgi:hypothetical protein
MYLKIRHNYPQKSKAPLEKQMILQPLSRNSQNIWNSKVHFRLQKNPLLVPILSQMNPVHVIPS